MKLKKKKQYHACRQRLLQEVNLFFTTYHTILKRFDLHTSKCRVHIEENSCIDEDSNLKFSYKANNFGEGRKSVKPTPLSK